MMTEYKDRIERGIMYKSMLYQYTYLLSLYSYPETDEKMALLFDKAWEYSKEQIWQEYDLQ